MNPHSLVAPTKTILKVKTLTPMWTGDIDGKSDRSIQLPGLMGSLRWWWEVLLRGVSANIGEPNESSAHDHPVNELFGTTDLRRAFRLQIQEDALHTALIAQRITSTYKDWFFKSNALAGTFKAEIISLRKGISPRDGVAPSHA